MKQMAGHPRLYRRGATYYHRAAIPVDIKETYPKTEELSSLRTKDYHEAVRLVRVESARVDTLFERHRVKMIAEATPKLKDLSREQEELIAEAYYRRLLEEDDDERLTGFQDRSFEDQVDDNLFFRGIARFKHSRGQPGYEGGHIDQLLNSFDISLRLDHDSDAILKADRALKAGEIKARQAIEKRNDGELVETPGAPRVPHDSEVPDGSVPSKTSPLLSTVIDEWLAEKTRTSWTSKTAKDRKIWTNHFLALVGNRPVGSYSKSDGRAFKEMLESLPANWVRQFWDWADRHYDELSTNPLKGLEIDLPPRNERDARHSFTIEDLQKIFDAPIFRGCKSETQWKAPGLVMPRRSAKFWLPLIGLYSGARLGEIAQLHTKDIKRDGDIWYFDINAEDEGKRLKTLTSRRRVPVHQTLIEIGILEHLHHRRECGETRLFPDIKAGSDGYLSSRFSKHFARFLVAIGIKTAQKTFHSFRHTFEDACRDSGLSKDVMDALQGHKEQGMSGRYGSGYSIKPLAAAIANVHYEGFSLGHLKK